MGLDQGGVGRDDVPGPEQHQVAGDDLRGWDAPGGAVSVHHGERRGEPVQCPHRLLGTALLQHPEGGVEHHHRRDDGGVGMVPGQRGDRAGDQQQQDHRVAQLLEHPSGERSRRWLRRQVRPVLAQAPCRLQLGQLGDPPLAGHGAGEGTTTARPVSSPEARRR